MKRKISRFFKESRNWSNEIELLRSIIKNVELEEEFKWSKPCYTFNGNNIAIIQPFKKCLGLMFFKGKLLRDPKKVLIDNGPNSKSAARMEFTSVQEVKKSVSIVKSYLKEAIKLEQSGQKIEIKKNTEPLPEELKAIFRKDSKFKKAFSILTPGRQRGYILHISGAKQSTTRFSRIEKCRPKIMEGKGFNDR